MGMIVEVITFIIDVFKKLCSRLLDKFLELNLFEKINFINTAGAFFAIILPVARYFIFETYFMINNPLAVYMIGIVTVMFITLYFQGKIVLIIREALNSYYLFWVIYLHLSGNLTKAPYEIITGYYINIAVPVIYMTASFLSYRFYESN